MHTMRSNEANRRHCTNMCDAFSYAKKRKFRTLFIFILFVHLFCILSFDKIDYN